MTHQIEDGELVNTEVYQGEALMTEPIQVLYLDDNPLDRELVRDALEREEDDFHLVEAYSFQEFKSLLARGSYDVVLSDLNLPGFDGFQVLDLVRAFDPDLPVVIITGTGTAERATAALKRGVADYIVKTPQHIQQLPATLWTALERKRQAEARRQAEAQLQFQAAILQNVRDSIIVTDLEGRIRYWNEGATAIFGYSAAEMMGKTVATLYPEYDPAQMSADLNQILTGQPHEGEWQGQRKDGSILWVDVKTTVMRAADGTATGFIGVSKDITERKQAEEGLRAAEEHLRTIMNSAPIVLFTLDRQGIFTLSTGQGLHRVGLQPGQLVGQSALDLYGTTPFIIEETGEVMPASEIIRRVFAGETVKVTSEIGGIFFEHHCTPLRDQQGEIVQFVGVSLDVTERNQAEDALREREEQLRLLFEGVKDHALYLLDPQGHIILWNKAAERMTGYRAEEIIDTHFSRFYPPEDIRAGKPQKTLAIARQEGKYREEGWRVRKDGSPFWANVTLTALYDPSGYLQGFAKITRDVTEQRQAEEKLAHHAAQFQGLAEISTVINASLSVNEILAAVTEQARTIIGAHQAVISLVEESNQDLVVKHVSLSDKYAAWRDYHEPPDGSGIHKLVCQSNSSMRLTQAELEAHPAWRGFGPAAGNHPPLRGWLAAPLVKREGKNIGLIQMSDKYEGEFSADDEAILVQLAQMASVAVENARLLAVERQAQKQLRDLANYLQAAREDERTRIAREIHDELGQALTALKIDLAWLGRRLPEEAPTLHHKTRVMDQLINSTIQIVRHLATELRPGLLDDLGLGPALEWQAREFSERTGVDCTLYLAETTIDRERATALFRIFQETLTNVARHAGATRVEVNLKEQADDLVLTVRDNGRGITKQQILAPTSLGLMGQRERARAWGGRVSITSRPGQGTTVTIRLPQGQAGEATP